MTPVDTLIHARWVIPVEPQGAVYDHYAVAITGGRIVGVGPTTELRQRYQPQESIHLPDHALIPGLINAHTHVPMSLFRGLADDLPLMEWLSKHIWPAESTWVGYEFVRDGSELAIAEMLRGGVTCFNDMYFFPDEIASVAAQTGMRATIGMILIDFPTVWAKNADEYLQKGIELHDNYRNHPLIRTAFAPHAPYTVSDGPLERVRVLADELDVPIHMHVHETSDEIQRAVAEQGTRPLERLRAMGLLSPRLLAVHMTHLTEDEIETVAATGVNVLHCPESNLKLASGMCPVQSLIDEGANVALGTDGNASNNDLDMWGEMRTAALLAKGLTLDASALPASETLAMATINGARALGLEEEIGSIAIGKLADLTAVNLATLEATPVYHPHSHLIYATGRHQVTDVWIAGKRMLRDRHLTTIDEMDLIARANRWRDKVKQYS